MVLEHIFPEDWLEKKGRYAFLLGVIYSFVGIGLAWILFRNDPALVAVAFTSLLLLPELYKIFSIEERRESMETDFSIKTLWRDDIDIIRIYFFLFLGIMFSYSAMTLTMDSLQTNSLFREQLEIRFGSDLPVSAGEGGQGLDYSNIVDFPGTFSMDLFYGLLSNNFLVLLACFIMALLTGDGAVFLISWNASVWGTIFGITAKGAATFTGGSTIVLFLLVLAIVFPHMMIEALSYFLAAISGSVISKDVILEKFASERFFEVFGLNLYLLLVALFFLLLGAVVETWVLDNVTIYNEIIKQSFAAFS